MIESKTKWTIQVNNNPGSAGISFQSSSRLFIVSFCQFPIHWLKSICFILRHWRLSLWKRIFHRLALWEWMLRLMYFLSSVIACEFCPLVWFFGEVLFGGRRLGTCPNLQIFYIWLADMVLNRHCLCKWNWVWQVRVNKVNSNIISLDCCRFLVERLRRGVKENRYIQGISVSSQCSISRWFLF